MHFSRCVFYHSAAFTERPPRFHLFTAAATKPCCSLPAGDQTILLVSGRPTDSFAWVNLRTRARAQERRSLARSARGMRTRDRSERRDAVLTTGGICRRICLAGVLSFEDRLQYGWGPRLASAVPRTTRHPSRSLDMRVC